MTGLNVVNFPKPEKAPVEAPEITEVLRDMAGRIAGAHGFVLVADMGAGKPQQIFVAGDGYSNAADALFLLALGQKRILEAAGSC